jgi:hypothetical protein
MASGIILGHAEPLEPSFGPQLGLFKLQIVYDLAAIGSVNERQGNETKRSSDYGGKFSGLVQGLTAIQFR